MLGVGRSLFFTRESLIKRHLRLNKDLNEVKKQAMGLCGAKRGHVGSKALRCQRLGSFKEEQGYVDGIEWAQEIMVGGDKVTELGGWSLLVGNKLL